MSDIHNEFQSYIPESNTPDVVVLAGDIHTKNRGVTWAEEHFCAPVLYVLGNHEAYGQTIPKYFNEIKSLTKSGDVRVLENEMITLDGINFFGCTLWTDFELITNPRMAGSECQLIMSDYKKIKRLPSYSKIRTLDTALYHKKSLKWLGEELNKRKGEKNVVITHHAPSIQSVPEHERANIISSAYASNLEGFIKEHDIKLWIHGHLHNSADYHIGNTRVICNPKGYPGKENPEYQKEMIVSV